MWLTWDKYKQRRLGTALSSFIFLILGASMLALWQLYPVLSFALTLTSFISTAWEQCLFFCTVLSTAWMLCGLYLAWPSLLSEFKNPYFVTVSLMSLLGLPVSVGMLLSFPILASYGIEFGMLSLVCFFYWRLQLRQDAKDLRDMLQIANHIQLQCTLTKIGKTTLENLNSMKIEMKKEITEIKQDMTTIKQEMVTKEMFDQHTTNMKQETKEMFDQHTTNMKQETKEMFDQHTTNMKQETKEMFDQHTTNMKQEMVTKQEINEMLKIHTDNIVTHLSNLSSASALQSQQRVLKKSVNKPLQRLEDDLKDCFAGFSFKCHITTDKELHIQCTNWLEMTQPISNSEDTLANNVELIKINLCKAFNFQRNSISFDEQTFTLIIKGKSENLELCLKTLGQMFPHSSTLSPQNNTQTFFSQSNYPLKSPTDEKNKVVNEQPTCLIM